MEPKSLFILIAGCVVPSLLIALLATPLIRRLAVPLRLVDLPGERKVHTQPTPRGGGIAIWLAVVSVFAAISLLVVLRAQSPSLDALIPSFARPHLAGIQTQLPKLWILLGAGTLLMLLGLADDRGGVRWQWRLLVEFVVAGCCVWLIPNLRLTAFLPFPLFTGLLSVLWIVTLINAFNMLDNMDGLSAGVAVIAASMLAAVMLLAPNPESQGPQLFVAGLLLVLVGGLVGFLWHNRPPARIFMGDSGAYFIGFTIAAATLLASYTGYKGPTRHAILAPLCMMAVPLYDLITVVCIRLASGKSPFEADKNHFSHRLVELGLTKTQAVLTVYLTTVTCGLAALLLHRTDTLGALFILLLIGSILAIIAILETTARRALRR